MPAKNKYTGRKIGNYIKYAIFTVNLFAILLLLLSTLAWVVRPSASTFIAYLGLGFPFILMLNIAFLALWLISLRWKYAVVQIVVLVIFANPISTYFPVHSKTKEVPAECIKVLSYNVRGFNWVTRKQAKDNPIFDYIAESKADIVCLQEFAVYPTKNGGIIAQQDFNKIMKMYPYRSVVRLGNKTTPHIYGIACYSKFPIVKTINLPIESTYNGSAIYEININGKIVTLVNNHLESNRITAEDKKLYKDFFRSKEKEIMLEEVTENIQDRLGVAYKIRENQVNVINDYLSKEHTDATILCGDFNDTPISYTYYKMKGDLIDSYQKTGFGQGITYHENKFLFRIDYIMHSKNIESYNTTVGKVKYSDHYPIWTYLRFK